MGECDRACTDLYHRLCVYRWKVIHQSGINLAVIFDISSYPLKAQKLFEAIDLREMLPPFFLTPFSAKVMGCSRHGMPLPYKDHHLRPPSHPAPSGPLPTYRRGSERFSRLFALQSWLHGWCACNGLGYMDNWSSFWEQPVLYRRDGLHPSPLGSVVLSWNIERAIR
ncbi:hypothetical protein SRHO_G00113240 [Serrasalmus rhombeus]